MVAAAWTVDILVVVGVAFCGFLLLRGREEDADDAETWTNHSTRCYTLANDDDDDDDTIQASIPSNQPWRDGEQSCTATSPPF
ncbi:hypothetical protein IWZ01DRAFT_499392 [Phyllosticta capitalensis]